MEEWRPVSGTTYWVSDAGRVKNRFGQILSSVPDKHSGYVKYYLQYGGRGTTKQGHVLVAEAFLQNPDKKPYVNHINGVRSDNRVANLEWVTPKENANKKTAPANKPRTKRVAQINPATGETVRVWDSLKEAARGTRATRTSISSCCSGKLQTTGGFGWKLVEEEAIPGEEWLELVHKDISFGVSSLGRVRYESGTITLGSLLNGYRVCHAKDVIVSVHKLVAMAFVPNPDPEMKRYVNHKDGDRGNNEKSNLEWVTPSENTQHAARELGLMKNRYQRRVRKLSLEGRLLAEYDSLKAAAKATGCSKGAICRACQGKLQKTGGFRWEYVVANEAPAQAQKLEAEPSVASAPKPLPDDDPLWAELGLEPAPKSVLDDVSWWAELGLEPALEPKPVLEPGPAPEPKLESKLVSDDDFLWAALGLAPEPESAPSQAPELASAQAPESEPKLAPESELLSDDDLLWAALGL